MRNVLPFLVLIGAGILAVTVLLPILGFIFLMVVIVVVVALIALLAAPLLAKLPWFRDRIVVRRYGNQRGFHFGNGTFTTYSNEPSQEPQQGSEGQVDGGDVIEVEGKELPDKE